MRQPKDKWCMSCIHLSINIRNILYFLFVSVWRCTQAATIWVDVRTKEQSERERETKWWMWPFHKSQKDIQHEHTSKRREKHKKYRYKIRFWETKMQTDKQQMTRTKRFPNEENFETESAQRHKYETVVMCRVCVCLFWEMISARHQCYLVWCDHHLWYIMTNACNKIILMAVDVVAIAE